MPPHTILLAGNPQYPQEKISSQATILPGHLVEFVPSGGDAGQLRRHATAGGNAMPAFAIERLVPDGTSTEAIDQLYADGETVRWIIGRPGDLIYALVPAAAAAIVAGSNLISNGDGTLKIAAAVAATEATSEAIVAQAAEAIDNSGGGSPARIRVRVI